MSYTSSRQDFDCSASRPSGSGIVPLTKQSGLGDTNWGSLLEQLRTDGFARIPGAIGPEELSGIQQALIETIKYRPKPFYATDFDFEHGGRAPDGSATNGDVLYRVKYSLNKHRRFLALLGNPVILSAASMIIAEPFIVCWDDLMVKEAGEPFGVPWHQDAESGGEGVYTIGVYIVGSGDNPLRVIPGSHDRGILSPTALSAFVRERAPQAVSIRAEAGDLVIHNNNIAHESGSCGTTSRYTIFFECRSVRMVLGLPNWGAAFVQKRKHFIAAAVRARESFAELVREDQQRKLEPSPFKDLWDFGVPLPPESEMSFRVSQSPDRWCLSPTVEHKQRAIEAFRKDRHMESIAAQFGVSEEALFKWLCESGVFVPNKFGRYSDAPELMSV